MGSLNRSQTALLVGLLLLLAATAAYWVGLRSEPGRFPRPVDLVSRGRPASGAKTQRALGEVIDQPLARGAPSSPVEPPAASPAAPAAATGAARATPGPTPTLEDVCRADWESMARSRVSDLQRDLLAQRPSLSPGCLRRMGDEVPVGFVRGFVRSCQIGLDQRTVEEIERVCGPQLPRFRAFAISRLRAGAEDLERFDVPDLANQLAGGFLDLAGASESDLERNARIADALIAKDPDFYPAYKGKLLSLLLQEIKYRDAVDPALYEGLYAELTAFRGGGNRDETLFEMRRLQAEATGATNQAPSALGAGAAGAAPLAPPTSAPPPEMDGLDADLVHIPFLRLSALGDVQGLSRLAEDYVAAYPDSYVGHLYLAEAAWKAGDRAAAANIFKQALGGNVTDAAALEVLTRLQGEPPLDRLARMGLN